MLRTWPKISFCTRTGFSNITIAAIARQLQVSHNHLTRQFMGERGMSAIQCLQHLRYQKCLDLMMQTDLSPKAISHELGFSELQQFNKFAKKMSGHSPRELALKTRRSKSLKAQKDGSTT